MRARGIEFETEDKGSGEAQALLWGHALMGSMDQEVGSEIMPWMGLDDANRLIRWDARGHGASEATLMEEDYQWPELAKDLWAVADGFELDAAILGGISMGSGTALHAAVMAPNRTIGMVLMAPPTGWETRPRQARLYRSSARILDTVGLSPFRFMGELAACVTSISSPNRSSENHLAKLQRSVMRGLRSADPRSVAAALRGAALSDLPSRDVLEKLDVPTLILAWTGDWSHPLSTAETLESWLPNASLDVASNPKDVQNWPHRMKTFIDELR
jgi:pimeloyl-ACP methyl ester carboxylesterase